ncbi:hypothetical protein BB434_02925 [Helicobacter pylori]|nr:hypothetical protein BB434_02925 [Helicobacter pylori]
MPENSKLQPAKLGKNFDPVDHSNRNFFFSLILSVLLHWLIYFLFEHREDFFPSKPKLVKLNPENLLVLKRGHSQDPNKNNPGAPKPTLAGPQILRHTIHQYPFWFGYPSLYYFLFWVAQLL